MGPLWKPTALQSLWCYSLRPGQLTCFVNCLFGRLYGTRGSQQHQKKKKRTSSCVEFGTYYLRRVTHVVDGLVVVQSSSACRCSPQPVVQTSIALRECVTENSVSNRQMSQQGKFEWKNVLLSYTTYIRSLPLEFETLQSTLASFWKDSNWSSSATTNLEK